MFQNTKRVWSRRCDFDGKVVLPDIYQRIEKKSDFFVLYLNGKCGLADVNGEIILECIYPEIIELPDKFVVQESCVREVHKKEISKVNKEA